MEGNYSDIPYKSINTEKNTYINIDEVDYSPEIDKLCDSNDSFGQNDSDGQAVKKLLFINTKKKSSPNEYRSYSPRHRKASFGYPDNESFELEQDRFFQPSDQLLTPKNQIKMSTIDSCQTPQRSINIRPLMSPGIESGPSSCNPFLSKDIDHDKSSLQDSMSILSNSSTSRYSQDFIEIDLIGHGQFGDVYKCQHILDNCFYAIKKLNLNNYKIRSKCVLQEIYTMAALSNRSDCSCYIIRYYTSWTESNYLFIQIEYCDAQLKDIMNTLTTEKKIIKLLKQMLKGLSYLHQNDIVHLDIKPDNIFIHDDIYKIGDLGLATLSNGSLYVEEGDQRYQPLEIMQDNFHQLPSVDIFSLGAMIYEICRNEPLPFEGNEWKDLRDGKIPLLNNYSQKLNDIIKQMMSENPKDRPQASQLLQSELFSKRIIQD